MHADFRRHTVVVSTRNKKDRHLYFINCIFDVEIVCIKTAAPLCQCQKLIFYWYAYRLQDSQIPGKPIKQNLCVMIDNVSKAQKSTVSHNTDDLICFRR